MIFETWEPQAIRCAVCGHQWDHWKPGTRLSIRAWRLEIAALHCRQCAAGPRQLHARLAYAPPIVERREPLGARIKKAPPGFPPAAPIAR